MKKLSILFSAILSLAAAAFPLAAQGSVVRVMRLEGAISQAMVLYVDRVMTQVHADNVELVIIELDTPGGGIDQMQSIVQSIRGSAVPVVVYVSPRGAHAGSAGTVITLAGHAAAMAPETAIGAASPVGGQGEDLTETLDRKVKEILKADVRALAEQRGPEAIALAEATIEEAAAATSDEALAAGLIDFIAEDLTDLLAQLDGYTVEVQGRSHKLATQNLTIEQVDMTAIEQLLNVLVNPLVVFGLLAVGVQAILIEMRSPGGWVAGFIGVCCLALALYGLGVLPVNWFGLAFVGLAIVLFIMELATPTFGGLATAGVASMVVGGLVLFNTSGNGSFQRISIPGLIGVSLASSAVFLFIMYKALEAQRRPVATGAEGLVGTQGVVRKALQPQGTVLVRGELWRAESDREVEVGTRVEVVAVEGLRLKVKPED
ncbi:MAG: nodulation protein NfeD [Anaerolineales bacterium]